VLDQLPVDVRETLDNFRVAEFSTLAKDGTPITWPVTVLFQPDKNRFVATTSIGLPQKAYNCRRNPKVSLLYSDPTACGLKDPPHVLVQGDANVSQLTTWNEELDVLYRRLAIWQGPTRNIGKDPISRWLMDWYFMRLLIFITPTTVRWWPNGDWSRPGQI